MDEKRRIRNLKIKCIAKISFAGNNRYGLEKVKYQLIATRK